ncbi:hypothetical protein SOVF_094350 [Spinacia oleracea]|nr:hypothetical protein SOVF_094350 [Spinacia oleracea]
MKQTVFIFFTVVFFLNPYLLVLSQNAEPCNSVIDYNENVNFDTTAMFCQTVWKSFPEIVLRYVQAGPQLWSFLLSAPNENSWLGIGFSTNGQMVGSSAMVGWFYENGTGGMKQYFLQGQVTNKVEPDAGELTVVDNSSTVFIQASRIHLAFQINTVEPRKELLYAVGPYGQLPVANGGFQLIEHREKSQASLDYTTGRSLVIFAISNIFYGIRLGMEGAGWYGTYAAILTLMVIVAIVLEIRLWRQR